MLGFLCKRWLPFSDGRWVMLDSCTELGFLRFYSIPYSSLVSGSGHDGKEKGHSFTASYLINTYELTPETAISISNRLQFENTKRPDVVLAFLKSHGFTNLQIAKLVRTIPSILLSNPDKTLLPKINFLSSIGASRPELTSILSKTSLFNRSLEKYIIPRCNFLKSVVDDDKKVISFLKNSTIFQEDIQKNVAPNIAFLREVGVPQPFITRYVGNFTTGLYTKHDIFKKRVDKIIAMGVNPMRHAFVSAVQTLCVMKQSTWDQKVKVYKMWGLSENEIQVMFKLHPFSMNVSEKKIMIVMDFFVNTMGWEPTAVVKNSTTLNYNFEKRIVPRCMVIRLLALKGILKKDLALSSFLHYPEKKFLAKYVTKYIKDVPELLSVYQGKMSFLELGSDVKKLGG